MNIMKIGAASALALATAVPAVAQTPYRPTDEYVRAQQQYEDQRAQYEDNRAAYGAARQDYASARRAYERRMADWERARADYDARYGYGAYARMNPRPRWDDNAWARSAPPPAPYADYYGQSASAVVTPCNNNSTVAGGVLGAVAGAVLGSNVAARNARPEGAILGGVVGAALGAGVGHANDRYKCDARGPYFSYGETMPYREGSNRYSSNYDSGYYTRERCRLAAAPTDSYGREMRYVRVCPDGDGRYRITG